MDAVVDYQPGDGWRYVVLVSDLPHAWNSLFGKRAGI